MKESEDEKMLRQRCVYKRMRSIFCMVLLLAVLAVQPVFAAGFNPSGFDDSGSRVIITNQDLLKVVTTGNQSSYSIAAGSSLTPFSTSPGSVSVGIGCGYCDGGFSGSGCGDECPDQWGFCQCMGNSTVTPSFEVVSTSNAAVATATVSGGAVTITGVGAGQATVTVRAFIQSNSQTAKYQKRYTVDKTITVTVQ